MKPIVRLLSVSVLVAASLAVMTPPSQAASAQLGLREAAYSGAIDGRNHGVTTQCTSTVALFECSVDFKLKQSICTIPAGATDVGSADYSDGPRTSLGIVLDGVPHRNAVLVGTAVLSPGATIVKITIDATDSCDEGALAVSLLNLGTSSEPTAFTGEATYSPST